MSAKESPRALARHVMDRPAAREFVPVNAGESFRWMEHDYPAPIARWNYHPEVEIHLIRKGVGTYIIGHEVGAFSAGHVAVVGSKVPHDWMSHLDPGQAIVNRDAVIQFAPSWLEQVVGDIPELHRTTDLVRQAQRGIIYSGSSAKAAAVEIEGVGIAGGTRRITHFFALLDILVSAPAHERHYVAHTPYSSPVGTEGQAAVNAGLSYVLENLSGDIRMAEAARLAFMSEPSFSKYFKKASGMTFSGLVRRLRIANACRLLEQTDAPVSEISSSVGYGNLANFNRQFRAETGVTPTAYRRLDESLRPSMRPVGGLRVDQS